MKLTASQRQEVKQWIKVCSIRGLSLKATIEVVNRQLPEGCALTMRGVQDYIATIKRESRSWLDTMALDVYEFIHEVKERWDELHELKKEQWKTLDRAIKNEDIAGQVKAEMAILKVNETLLQIDMTLPTVAIPSQYQQQPQPLPTRSVTTTRPILDEDDLIDGDDQP